MTDLPRGWTEATLENLFLTVLGGDWGKAPNDSLEDSSLVRCIRASELRKWHDENGKSAAIRRLKRSSIEKRRLQEGDILVEVSGGGPDQAVGRTVLITKMVLKNDPELDYVCTNFFRFCRPSRNIQSNFLNWYLTYFYRSGGTEELQGGSNNLRNLRFPDFVSQLVPIPPLSEQRRIVEKIEAMFDEIDNGVESLQKARTALGLYRQSLLKSAFEGRLTADWRAQNADKLESPETLLTRIQKEREDRYKAALDAWQEALAKWREGGEKGKKPTKPKRPETIELSKTKRQQIHHAPEWAVDALGNHVDFLTSGSRGWAKFYASSGATFIRAQNLKHDLLDLNDIAHVKLPTGSSEGMRTRVQRGDVLITITGANVTKTAVVLEVFEEAYVSQHVALCRLSPTILPRFAWHFLISEACGRKQLECAAYGAGKPGLNLTNILEVAIPICSPAEQAEIVRILDARLEAADALETEIDAALSRSDALRQSILKKAFSGRLVPQDPNDEPASILLERIKAERAKTPRKKRKKATA